MWRAWAAVFWVIAASQAAYAQTRDADVLTIAIESVCAPYVIDRREAEEIPALQGLSFTLGRYDLSGNIRVGLSGAGEIRLCTIGIEGDDPEAARALVFDATSHWPVALEYRGDRPPGIGFIRKEVFCPPADGVQTAWLLLSRDQRSQGRLALGIMRSTSPIRDCTRE
jgi:hypothetical protein